MDERCPDLLGSGNHELDSGTDIRFRRPGSTPFGRHGSFALDDAGGQAIDASGHARCPSGFVAELGCACYAGYVTHSASLLVKGFTTR